MGFALLLTACEVATTSVPGESPTPAAVGQPARIRDIQGRAHVSPLQFKSVADVRGVVTATRPDGFWLQDPEPDDDVCTSEGIFVNARFAPRAEVARVGEMLAVSGRVMEARSGSANLSVTQLQLAAVRRLGTAPVPTPVVIGAAGRRPPTSVIDDDANGDVEERGSFDCETDGIDFYESLEGMLVRVDAAVVVGATNRFGEVVVLADGGAGATGRTRRGAIAVRANDFNPERVIVDDELLKVAGRAMPAANVGDRIARIVGVMDYSFGNFKLQATEALAVTSGGLQAQTARRAGPGEFAVATLNVENLDPSDPPGKFAALARIIVANLGAPDLLALEEVQDNNGRVDDAVVDASETYRALIAAIRAAGGPSYEFRDIPPVDDQDGGEPGGNIRVGFLFRTDRGLAFVDRPGGTSTAGVRVERAPDGGPRLSFSPGRVAPGDVAFAQSRKPLAGEFTFEGRRLFVVANHFIAKLGDEPLFGRYQPPTPESEGKRLDQARLVHDFARSILAVDPGAPLIVLGDLNDFPFAAPLRALTGSILHNLMERLPEEERYTFIFDGNAQALDHILVSAALREGVAEYGIVHVNVEFSSRASDHEPQVAIFRLPRR